MAHPTNCPHCRAILPAPRSRLLTGLALIGAYTVSFAGLFGMACLGPLNIPFLPFYLAAAIGGITAAHAYASEPFLCPACNKEIEQLSIVEQVEPAPALPARARA